MIQANTKKKGKIPPRKVKAKQEVKPLIPVETLKVLIICTTLYLCSIIGTYATPYIAQFYIYMMR